MARKYTTVARLRNAQLFREYTDGDLGVTLRFDEDVESGPQAPLAQPYPLQDGKVIGNRFAVLPMEGWDGTRDGLPTEYTERRWTNFGKSGAKLIWGCEAIAVRHDGRANPNQLIVQDSTLKGIEQIYNKLVSTHKERYDTTDDLLVGMQLTHSGRFARPNEKTRLEPMILYHHPVLEEIYNVDPDLPVLTDAQIEGIIAEFPRAAKQAQELGFDFVDIKHCHGYLGHEFLSAYSRPGPYGGSFENRTRFLREIVSGIRSEAPGMRIGVRISAFDMPPFRPDESGIGEPRIIENENGEYPYGFGADPKDPMQAKLDETFQFIALLKSLDIELVNLSAGSPYYNPHMQRPAYFPPSDGYQPPEDPLVGVARQINTHARIKEKFPEMAMVGTGYSYLQEWLPNVGQYNVRNGLIDFVGLGRMILSYPGLPADVLAGKELDRKHICRTFSDCTTAPRNGMISGCFPLDEFYKELPQAETLKEIKAES